MPSMIHFSHVIRYTIYDLFLVMQYTIYDLFLVMW